VGWGCHVFGTTAVWKWGCSRYFAIFFCLEKRKNEGLVGYAQMQAFVRKESAVIKKWGKNEKKWGKMVCGGEKFSIFASKSYKIKKRMRFFGNIEAKTDAKGRVFLPSVFRKQLQAAGEEQLVLRTSMSGDCLVLYPESVWMARVDAIAANVSEWIEEEQMVLRAFMAEAESCELDGNGRFLIPKRLQQAADIRQGVRFIGMNDTIEIWALEKTEKPFVPQADFAARMKALMSKSRQV